MSRPSELFAIGAIALLVVGLASAKLSVFHRVYVDISIHHTSYAIPAKTPLFGLAALFGVFACVYSVWLIDINHTAAMWHFWLSIIGVVLFFGGFAVIATSQPSPASSSLDAVEKAGILGTFLAFPVFIAGQLVFATSVTLALTRWHRAT